MGQRRGLIDSNVLVAAFDLDHKHHAPSFALLDASAKEEFATATHCLSEFMSVATRSAKQGGSAMHPKVVHAALKDYLGDLELLAMTADEHVETLLLFAGQGGIGSRVYDFLIGRVAALHAIPLIVTWNVKHFVPLFPRLRVATPAELLQET